MHWKALCVVIGILGLFLPARIEAHEERPVQFPSGFGSVPVYRVTGPHLVVCAPDSLERIKDYPGVLRATNRRLFFSKTTKQDLLKMIGVCVVGFDPREQRGLDLRLHLLRDAGKEKEGGLFNRYIKA